MKTITIRHRWTNATLYTCEVADDDPQPIRTAVKAAILAGADLADTNLARANLADADLAGANLADADLAGANLAGADLADANLARAYLARADLAGANLARADLAGANLARADLAGANLAGAYLAGANLAGANNVPGGIERTDPQTPYVRAISAETRRARLAARAVDYRSRHPEVPVVDQLDRRILDAITIGGGMLEMSNWHGEGGACGTTHCRAGWAVHLAGDAGIELERRTSPEAAGRAIYLASTGRSPHFYASNDRALEDIKRCAAIDLDATEPTP